MMPIIAVEAFSHRPLKIRSYDALASHCVGGGLARSLAAHLLLRVEAGAYYLEISSLLFLLTEKLGPRLRHPQTLWQLGVSHVFLPTRGAVGLLNLFLCEILCCLKVSSSKVCFVKLGTDKVGKN